MEKIDTIYIDETNDVEANIYQDESAESPRDWDNMGTIYYKHRDYTLGEHELTAGSIEDYMRQIADNEGFAEAQNDDEVSDENIEKWIEKHLIIKPIYIYDHSGITISTGAFSCPWDSGQCGYIVAKKGAEEMTDEGIDKCLEQEIKTFDEYLRGDVYGYQIMVDGDETDSCWGYFGYDYCIEEATSALKHEWKRVEAEQKEGKQLSKEAQA